MAEGFYKFRPRDVEGLTLLLKHIPARVFEKRCRMVLHCLARTYEPRAGVCDVPYFTVGQRTLAEATGASPRSCQMFFEIMEKDGWIVRRGEWKTKAGLFTLRTFCWMEPGWYEDNGIEQGATPDTEENVAPGATYERCTPATLDTGLHVAPVQRPAGKKRCTSDCSYSQKGGPVPVAGAPAPSPKTATAGIDEIVDMYAQPFPEPPAHPYYDPGDA